MRQVKLFKSVEAEIRALEGEINRWIAANKVEIVRITGNIAPQTAADGHRVLGGSDVLVIVEYEV